jgi:predicted enzyme related to lactoylglutathione lyase
VDRTGQTQPHPDAVASRLFALCIAANDPHRLAGFWQGVLGWRPAGGADALAALLPTDDTGFRLRFLPTDEPKTRLNQMHFDLTSASLEEQEATVARALSLGGRHFDVGQLPEEEHVVLADPEDNEFCVIEPGNGFLADCGFVGAVSSEGTRALGHFWSAALGWPLVWDQDEETAVRSPHGGPKVTWGGPPLKEKTGPNRWHLDLVTADGGDQQREVERLVALGARRTGTPAHDPGAVALLDPDGNEICLLPPG